MDRTGSSSSMSSTGSVGSAARQAQRRTEQKRAAVIREKLIHTPAASSVEYHIRAMELKDCAACFHLGEKVFTSQFPNLYRLWDEYEVIDAFSSDNNMCFVAETSDKKLVGFIFGDEIKKRNSWRYGYVHWIAVDPMYRRRGIATELYNRVVPLMKEAGVRMILCDTPADNYVARAYFEKLGFATPINHVYMSLNVSQQTEASSEQLDQITSIPRPATPLSLNAVATTPISSVRRSRRGRSESTLSDDQMSNSSSNGFSAAQDEQAIARRRRRPNVIVREMMIDDINEVYELGERVFGDRRSPNLFRFWEQAEVLDLFETDSEFCLVAEIDEQIVGFSLGTTIKKKRSAWKYGYLIWLGVSPEHQGQGIGVVLFQHFQEVAVSDGARMLFIDTQADSPAVHFWQKQGFGHSQAHVFLSKRIDKEPGLDNEGVTASNSNDQDLETSESTGAIAGSKPLSHHHHPIRSHHYPTNGAGAVGKSDDTINGPSRRPQRNRTPVTGLSSPMPTILPIVHRRSARTTTKTLQ